MVRNIGLINPKVLESYAKNNNVTIATPAPTPTPTPAPTPTPPTPTPTPEPTKPTGGSGLLNSASQESYLDSITSRIRSIPTTSAQPQLPQYPVTPVTNNAQQNLSQQLANIASVPTFTPVAATVPNNQNSYVPVSAPVKPSVSAPAPTNTIKTTTQRTPAATPPAATGGSGSGSGGMLAQASQTTAKTYDAAQLKDPAQWAVDNNQTAQGQLNNIIAADSPLMQQAATRGLSQASSRGLLNSSMAVGAAQDSVLAAATPLAQFDAAQFGNAAKFNTENKNTFAVKNNESTNTSRQFNTSSLNHASDFNAAASNQASLANSENQFKQAMNTQNIASNESMQSAQLASNEALQSMKLASDAQLQAGRLAAEQALQEGRITSEQFMQQQSIGSQYGLAEQGFGFETSKINQQGSIAAQAAAQAAGYTSVRDAALHGYDAETAANLASVRADEAAKAAGYTSVRDAQLNGYDVQKAVNAAEIQAIRDYQLHGYDLETATNLAATNMTAQQYGAQADVILANLNNNAQMDRSVLQAAGSLAQDFNNALAGINADPSMSQQAKDYASHQLFKNYKNNVSMVEQVGTIPDVSTLLKDLNPNATKPTADYYNTQATDKANLEAQRIASEQAATASTNQMYADFAKAAATPKGGKMICTRLHELGYMEDHIFEADDSYAMLLAKNYPEFLAWYQSWAVHVVNAMHCKTITSKLLSRGLWVFVSPWSKEMAYRMRARSKGHWFGSLMMKISHWLYLISVK